MTTVSARSYGTASGVAAYVGIYTNAGDFDAQTIPTLLQVENFLNQVSSIMNSALASYGFTTPVTQVDVRGAITGVVEQEVVELCHLAHAAGRFQADRELHSSPLAMSAIRKEIYGYVLENAPGWEALGAARAASERDSIGFRDTDNAGNPTAPIFQRSAFGNVFQDWDPR